MIESVKIKNFRCFEELDIPELKPVTLVSGLNNIGKTTLLEALFFMYDHVNGTPFHKINNTRSYVAFRDTDIQNLWESVFYNMDTEKAILVETVDDGEKMILRIEKEAADSPHLPADIREDIRVNVLTSLSLIPYALKMEYRKGDYVEKGDYVNITTPQGTPNQNQFLNGVRCTRGGNIVPMEKMRSMLFVTPYMLRDESFLTDCFSKISVKGDKEKLLEIVQIVDADISDLMISTNSGFAQLYMRKNGMALPVKYSGDGLIKLLGLASRIMAYPDSIIMIDEIDTGMHYSMLPQMWSIIAKIAMANSSQIIATTHSYECIEAAINGIQEKDMRSCFEYIRLDKVGEAALAKTYDYEVLRQAVNACLEVR